MNTYLRCKLCKAPVFNTRELSEHMVTWHGEYRTERDPVFANRKPGWSRYHYKTPVVKGLISTVPKKR